MAPESRRISTTVVPSVLVALTAVLAPSVFAQDLTFSFADAKTVAESDLTDASNPAPFAIEPIAGTTVKAGTLWLEVPSNRSKPGSDPIRLPVVRLYTEAENPAPPVVFLAGGPGDSAINSVNAAYARAIFMNLLKTRDVILMDQRGAGRSRPSTLWISMAPLPENIFLSRDIALAEFRKRHTMAKGAFEKRGLDLSGYNDLEAAADLEALRRALGVEKIALLAFSYGTHLALATIRHHPGILDAVVLAGVEGPADTYKLPSVYDAQLDRIIAVVKKDPAWAELLPDMKASWTRILARAEEEPFQVEIERRNKKVTLPVGPFGLQWIVRRDLGDTNDLPRFPNLFYTLEHGDVSAFRFYVQRRYNEWGRGLSGMSLMTDMSSGASPDRIARIEQEAKTALFGNAMNFEYYDVRDIWGNADLGEAERAPVRSNVRALFISGTLDCQTPPDQAEEIREGFPNGVHLIVENAGHESTLPNPDVQRVITDFFEGKPVADQTIRGELEFLPPRRTF